MNLTQQKSQRPFIQNAKHVSSQSQDLSQAQNVRINFQPLINLNKARNISLQKRNLNRTLNIS